MKSVYSFVFAFGIIYLSGCTVQTYRDYELKGRVKTIKIADYGGLVIADTSNFSLDTGKYGIDSIYTLYSYNRHGQITRVYTSGEDYRLNEDYLYKNRLLIGKRMSYFDIYQKNIVDSSSHIYYYSRVAWTKRLDSIKPTHFPKKPKSIDYFNGANYLGLFPRMSEYYQYNFEGKVESHFRLYTIYGSDTSSYNETIFFYDLNQDLFKSITSDVGHEIRRKSFRQKKINYYKEDKLFLDSSFINGEFTSTRFNFTYNQIGDWLSFESCNIKGEKSITSFEYVYDEHDNWTTILVFINGNLVSGQLREITYY